jgi:hypothetical protein
MAAKAAASTAGRECRAAVRAVDGFGLSAMAPVSAVVCGLAATGMQELESVALLTNLAP